MLGLVGGLGMQSACLPGDCTLSVLPYADLNLSHTALGLIITAWKYVIYHLP